MSDVPDKVVNDMIIQMEMLSTENDALHFHASSLNSEVEALEVKNQELESKCKELERLNAFWKAKVEGWSRMSRSAIGSGSISSGSSGSTDEEEEEGDEAFRFYEKIIEDLVREQEELKKQIAEIDLSHQRELDGVLEECHQNVQQFTKECEALIHEVLQRFEERFGQLKREYEKAKSDLNDNHGSGVLAKFKDLPQNIKGIVVATFAAINAATAGWSGWGFINWLWDKIVNAAKCIYRHRNRIQGVYSVYRTFTEMESFVKFIQAWEQGKTMAECLGHFATTKFLKDALKVAPDLLTRLMSGGCSNSTVATTI